VRHTSKSGRHRRSSSKSQENVSILSHSSICIALALLRASATDCNASNEN
jgi:hypothetical protein